MAVVNSHRNHDAYSGRVEGWEGGTEVEGEADIYTYRHHQNHSCINPLPALVTSYDIHGEVLTIRHNDVTRRSVRIPTVHACLGKAGFYKNEHFYFD